MISAEKKEKKFLGALVERIIIRRRKFRVQCVEFNLSSYQNSEQESKQVSAISASGSFFLCLHF